MDDELTLLRNANNDLSWLQAHYLELVKKYDNHFIAVKDGCVVTSSASLGELLKELEGKGLDRLNVLIKFVSSTPTVWRT